MNTEGSIAEFFYNIVPGSLFLIFLNYCYGFDVIKNLRINSSDSAVIIFVYIIIGLFLGFLFQCFTKIIRENFWNEIAFGKVRENNCDEFELICEEILDNNRKKDKCINKNKIFHLMDSFLRGKEPAFLPTHFSSRFAFWANIFWGAFLLLILGLFFDSKINLTIWLLITLAFSLWIAHRHLINFYDSILKSFYMTHKEIKDF